MVSKVAATHAGMQSIPTLGGSGVHLPGNFEKSHFLKWTPPFTGLDFQLLVIKAEQVSHFYTINALLKILH